MGKWLILFFVLTNIHSALSQGTVDWLSIDCGSSSSYHEDGILWETDDDYILTGSNQLVSVANYTNWTQMNTLRAFTQQNKNCYTLPKEPMTRYFIRAMFKYGNYDRRSNPPTFDLEIDGNKMGTVDTSVAEIVYYEIVYASEKATVSVCLDRIRDNQYPFISSLEAWPLDDKAYTGLSRDLAWEMSYRYNYGVKYWILGYRDDDHSYNRIWEPKTSTDLVNVSADTEFVSYTTFEEPPDKAIFNAVEAPISGDSIILSFPSKKTNSLNLVMLYYTEMRELEINVTRSFDVYVDKEFIENKSPQYQNFTATETLAHPQLDVITVELRPTNNSTLPPLISAIEVYTASGPLVTTGTSQDDLIGLEALISGFEKLQGWSGEPCLPAESVWEWLTCAGADPPRVITLNLQGYGLNGTIPDFSEMQALESINLSNNGLNGSIPDFLGNLPNLSLLDLRSNNLSGQVPDSIKGNKKIKCLTKGNPNLVQPGKDKTGLIVGLAVGIPLAAILVCILIYVVLKRRQPPGQGPTTSPETGVQAENVTTDSEVSAMTEAGLAPSAPFVSQSLVHTHNNAMVPEMDLDELNERLQEQDDNAKVSDQELQHVNAKASDQQPKYDNALVSDGEGEPSTV